MCSLDLQHRGGNVDLYQLKSNNYYTCIADPFSLTLVLLLFKAGRPCGIGVFMHSQSHSNFLLQQANSSATWRGNSNNNIAIRLVTDLQKNNANF